MTTPTFTGEALLVRLDRLGIDAIPIGSELRLAPRTDAGEEALTEELVIECRLVKPDLLEAARLRAQSEPTAWLLSRLTAGQTWLTETHTALNALPGAGLTDPRNALFCNGMDLWDRLESLLRRVLRYRPDLCIHGSGGHCPPDAAVRCDACVSRGGDND